MRKILFILKSAIVFAFLLLCCLPAHAQVTAASCNTSDVQAAINTATEGQTVTIPACPSGVSWTSGVTISGKGITVQGAGSGRIIAYSSTTLALGTGARTLTVSGTGVAGNLPAPVAPAITNGETLKISETGNRQNFLLGTVTSFNSSSGSLVMSISSVGGTCGTGSSGQSPSNCARWLISTVPQTVFINNAASGTSLFTVTEDSSVNTRVGGFKIQEGTGQASGFTFVGGGGMPIVLHDCWIEQGLSPSDSVHTSVNRGLVYNCSFDSTPFSMAALAVHLQPFDQTAWTGPGYWGALDTNGAHNFYVESSDFHAYLNATDNDEAARSVWRYSTFDNAGFGTHGVDTGLFGQRYFEYYENVGNFNGYSNGKTFDQTWWFYVRGGSYIIYNNTLPNLTSTDYGGSQKNINMTEMALQRNAGPIPCWGAGTSGGADYYAPRQVGMGYVTGTGVDGIGSSTYSIASYGYPTPQYVGDLEPAYIWNNSITPESNVVTSDYGSAQSDSCTGSTYDTSANYIVLNRNYYNGTTAKPGYTPYQYPHPLTGGGSEGTITISPGSVTCPNANLNTPILCQAFAVSNGSTGAATGVSIGFSGTNPTEFPQTNNCGTSIPGSGSCTITANFSPINTGIRTALLNVTATLPVTGTVTATATLFGTGLATPPAPAPTFATNFSGTGTMAANCKPVAGQSQLCCASDGCGISTNGAAFKKFLTSVTLSPGTLPSVAVQ